MKVYERSIKALVGRSPTEFREEQGRELIAAKVRDLVRTPVRVSEVEARESYIDEKSTASLTYVQVRQTWVAKYGVATPAADVDPWSKEPANMGIIDAAVRERSGNHLRHILAKFASSPPTPEDKTAAKKKIDGAMARLKAGEPFPKVAKELSEDGSAAQGGDLGEKTDSFVEPFKVAADKLKPGEMTPEPVETEFGFHIIMRDGVRTEAQLAELRKEVARELYAKTKAPDAAKALADRMLAAIKAGQSADDAVKDALAPIVASYAAAHPPPPVRAAPAAAKADAGAPDATVGGDASASTAPPVTDTPDTDPTRPQVVTTSSFNKGGDPIPALTPDATTRLMKFAFGDAKDGAVLGEPLKADDGLVVAQLKQHKTATKEEFEKDKETYVPTLIARKQAEALSLYVKRLRAQEKTDIKVDDKYMADKLGKDDGGAPPPSSEDEDEGF
jgi:peptidyl-prolyl cis-trans isomerase D